MKNKVSRVMLVSVITNIFLALIKVVTGFLFKSAALISDGIHSFSDLLTDVVAIFGSHLASKPADKEHPYGHGKIEYLTSLVIGLVVIAVSLEVIHKSIMSKVVIPSILVAIVSLVTIVLKLLLSRYIIHQGKKMNNNILIASGSESSMDVISSLVVLVASLLMQLGSINKIFSYSDIIASVIVGIFIFKAGVNIIRDNLSVVLGAQETDRKYVSKIKKLIRETDGVVDVTSLVIMKFGHKSSLTLTITMNGSTTIEKAHEITDIIEEKIRKYSERIEFINIHIEPNKVN